MSLYITIYPGMQAEASMNTEPRMQVELGMQVKTSMNMEPGMQVEPGIARNKTFVYCLL